MYNRILVIGMGSAGKRHAAICKAFGCDVRGWDVVGDWPAIDWSWPQAVFICTPPDSHLAWARHSIYIYGGLPTFIEKPLGLPSQLEQWEEWLAIAEAPVAVGYQLRYHDQYKALEARMPEYGDDWQAAWLLYFHDLRKWRPEQDYRQGYIVKPREQGGGIIMDASHELDMAQWLFGMPEGVRATANDGGIEGMQAEAIADIDLLYPQGRVCRVHIDGVMPEKRRGALVVFDRGWESADGRDGMQAAYEAQDRHFLMGYHPVSNGWTALDTLRLIGQCHKAIGG